jgi:integrase/recombinase XerC
MDLRTIQELLGHENLDTTQKYTQRSMNELVKVYDRAHPHAKKDREERAAKGAQDEN